MDLLGFRESIVFSGHHARAFSMSAPLRRGACMRWLPRRRRTDYCRSAADSQREVSTRPVQKLVAAEDGSEKHLVKMLALSKMRTSRLEAEAAPYSGVLAASPGGKVFLGGGDPGGCAPATERR